VRWICTRYGWEMAVTDKEMVISRKRPSADQTAFAAAPSQALLKRLKAIIIPRLAFEDTPVSAVFAFIATRSRELDPDSEGVEFQLQLKPATAGAGAATEPTVTIELDNLPVGEAVRYICAKLDLKYRVTRNVVVIYQP
jgi:hypothetical protein